MIHTHKTIICPDCKGTGVEVGGEACYLCDGLETVEVPREWYRKFRKALNRVYRVFPKVFLKGWMDWAIVAAAIKYLLTSDKG